MQTKVAQVGELLIRAAAVIGTLSKEEQAVLSEKTDGKLIDCLAWAIEGAAKVSQDVVQSMSTHPPIGFQALISMPRMSLPVSSPSEVTSIALDEENRMLVFDFYPYEPGNPRGASWRLVDGDDHIRFLNEYEGGYIAAAIKAANEQHLRDQVLITTKSNIEAVEALKAAMTTVGIPADQRVDLIGHFCNERNTKAQAIFDVKVSAENTVQSQAWFDSQHQAFQAFCNEQGVDTDSETAKAMFKNGCRAKNHDHLAELRMKREMDDETL